MSTVIQPRHDRPLDEPLGTAAAWDYVAARALRDAPGHSVGLELEQHVVDLDFPALRPTWDRVRAAVDALPDLPGASLVTLEPGGQVELSGPPLPGAAAAAQALRRDDTVLRSCLREHGLGLASLGSDPVRRPQRVNPAPRYTAMERHWSATGTAKSGLAMMCATASLQVNLDAGPRSGWQARLARAHRLGPVLVALSACSPLLPGYSGAWRSQRQRVWGELDPLRCGPVTGDRDPSDQWADFALCAPVMLVGDRDSDTHSDSVTPIRTRVPFRDWAGGEVLLAGRRPTVDDLDRHLTTLFPPVRLRGFLEIRYLDALPVRWWPSLAALVAALMDDPDTADAVDAACEPVEGRWAEAARDGLSDPELARAAGRCLEAVDGSRFDLWREMVATRRGAGDALLDRARAVGPLRLLEEECR